MFKAVNDKQQTCTSHHIRPFLALRINYIMQANWPNEILADVRYLPLLTHTYLIKPQGSNSDILTDLIVIIYFYVQSNCICSICSSVNVTKEITYSD